MKGVPLMAEGAARAGRVLQKPVQQELDAEIVDGAAKKNRRGFVGKHGGIVPVVAGVFEHFQFLYRLMERGVIEAAANEFIVQAADLDGGAVLAADGALEQVHLAGLTVEDALEISAAADGPVDGERADTEHALEFIEKGERIFHGAVALVHEGEDGHATAAADLEKLAGLRLDALGGINHHDDRVHGGEDAVGVLGKIVMAGGVEEIEGGSRSNQIAGRWS